MSTATMERPLASDWHRMDPLRLLEATPRFRLLEHSVTVSRQR